MELPTTKLRKARAIILLQETPQLEKNTVICFLVGRVSLVKHNVKLKLTARSFFSFSWSVKYNIKLKLKTRSTFSFFGRISVSC